MRFPFPRTTAWLTCILLVCCLVPAAAHLVRLSHRGEDLLQAVDSSDVARVRALLKEGASPNTRNRYGGLELQMALMRHHVEVARELVDAGADVNAVNPHGDTMLMIAAPYDDQVQLLLDHGAKLQPQNARGQTALMFAARCNIGAPSLRLLLHHGADPAVRDYDGSSALDHAERGGWPENIRILRRLESARRRVNTTP